MIAVLDLAVLEQVAVVDRICLGVDLRVVMKIANRNHFQALEPEGFALCQVVAPIDRRHRG